MPEVISKIVLGTAAWGAEKYGINGDCPSTREIRAIIRLFAEYGVDEAHVKEEYNVRPEVLDILDEHDYTKVGPPSTYGLDNALLETKTECGREWMMVEYNPLRQFVVEGLGDYTGLLYVRSIFMQGVLLRPGLPSCAETFCAWLDKEDKTPQVSSSLFFLGAPTPTIDRIATAYSICVGMAFCHPWVDKVCVGINSYADAQRLLYTLGAFEGEYYDIDDTLRSFCCGDIPETDPRTW